jgi:hypothetical protein
VQLEVEYLRNDVRGCINNVSTWMGDEHVEKNLVTLLDDTLIHYDPLGMAAVGILGHQFNPPHPPFSSLVLKILTIKSTIKSAKKITRVYS